jgi:dolichyl-phosphate-mannose--protein O-mannosyl transferase
LLLTCSTYWALLRTVRNSMGNFIKPLVFVLVVLAIWWLAVRVFSRSAHAPRRRAPSGAGRDIVELGPAG